jgi:hypothetical protein
VTTNVATGISSRDGRIRTGDPLNPIQVRYRTAPRPVPGVASGAHKFAPCASRRQGAGRRPVPIVLPSRAP